MLLFDPIGRSPVLFENRTTLALSAAISINPPGTITASVTSLALFVRFVKPCGKMSTTILYGSDVDTSSEGKRATGARSTGSSTRKSDAGVIAVARGAPTPPNVPKIDIASPLVAEADTYARRVAKMNCTSVLFESEFTTAHIGTTTVQPSVLALAWPWDAVIPPVQLEVTSELAVMDVISTGINRPGGDNSNFSSASKMVASGTVTRTVMSKLWPRTRAWSVRVSSSAATDISTEGDITVN